MIHSRFDVGYNNILCDRACQLEFARAEDVSTVDIKTKSKRLSYYTSGVC